MFHNEQMKKSTQGMKVMLQQHEEEAIHFMALAKGSFHLKMWDAKTGDVLCEWEKLNLITLDAGIIAARLFKNSQDPAVGVNNGINMLAIGTGATGNILNPDAPQQEQRRLNNEICRKAFSSAQFRNAEGVAVAYPTNIVDFTTVYGESEAVGPLNEMTLMHTYSQNPATKNLIPTEYGGASYDPTFDVTNYDLMANYLTFSVISKPSTAILSITWRLTF